MILVNIPMWILLQILIFILGFSRIPSASAQISRIFARILARIFTVLAVILARIPLACSLRSHDPC
jgi:hypothetical protein